jgi:four helix bundle suffix protein
MRARLAGQLGAPMHLVLPPAANRTEFFDEPLLAALNALQAAAAEVCANIMLCLTNQASYLLGRQVQRLEGDFVQKGGFTERLYQSRKDYRDAKVRESETSYSESSYF